MLIYCIKCREKKEVEKVEERKLRGKNKWGVDAKCPDCGTKIFRFIKKKIEKETEYPKIYS